MRDKTAKKLIEIVLFMAGMMIYHINIFGEHNITELNHKISQLLETLDEA